MSAKQQAEVIADFFQELGYGTYTHPDASITLKRDSRARGENIALIIVDDLGNIMIDWDRPAGFVKAAFKKAGLSQYIVEDQPKFKTLEIRGKRWFARDAGNTYHTAEIIVDGKRVHKTPRAYGYGEQYVQSAMEWLIANGHLSLIWKKRPLWRLRDYGVKYEAGVEDVPRQKDL